MVLYSVQSTFCQTAAEKQKWQHDELGAGKFPGDWPGGEEPCYLATSEG